MNHARKILAILAVLFSVFAVAGPASASPLAPIRPATTSNGIWWTNVSYPGGIAAQVQYQVTHNGSTPWVRVVGFNAWVGDGSCFLSANVSEYDASGARRGGPITYSWNGVSPCYHQITVDANLGQGFTTSQMGWMEDTVGAMHGGLGVVTTSHNGSITPVIGG